MLAKKNGPAKVKKMNVFRKKKSVKIITLKKLLAPNWYLIIIYRYIMMMWPKLCFEF